MKSVANAQFQTSVMKDVFGTEYSFTQYGEIPVINPKYAEDGSSLILPTNETYSSRTGICNSLYLVIYGEEADMALASNRGLHVHDLGKVGAEYQTLCELDIAQECLNPKAILRIQGIVLP
jgi:hypothetical protein